MKKGIDKIDIVMITLIILSVIIPSTIVGLTITDKYENSYKQALDEINLNQTANQNYKQGWVDAISRLKELNRQGENITMREK